VVSEVLVADSVRIDAQGTPVIERLTVTTTGANVVVLGAPNVLFETCAGTHDVTNGTLKVSGMAPRDAVRGGWIASAPADVTLPPRWTILELARESARLAGHPRGDGNSRAAASLHALQLDALGGTRLGVAEPAVRRAAVLAAALATGAETLLVCDFTAGLPDGAARSLARLFVAACESSGGAPARRWVLFAGQLSLSSPLGLHADEALVFAGGRLVHTGSPAEIATRDRTYSVRLVGEGAAAFATLLRERGAQISGDPEARALTVTLPEALSTLEMITMAQAGNVVVVELLPVSDTLT
jgi:hypothetical protein